METKKKNRYGIPEGKVRFPLTLTDENAKKLREVAEEFKMTPSALISHVIETELTYKVAEYLVRR